MSCMRKLIYSKKQILYFSYMHTFPLNHICIYHCEFVKQFMYASLISLSQLDILNIFSLILFGFVFHTIIVQLAKKYLSNI